MKAARLSVVVLGLLCVDGALSAKDYYVAPGGGDADNGSRGAPWATIQRAADVMAPGDTCILRGGVYRQTVRVRRGGGAGRPVRFVAAAGENVVLDGADPVKGAWTRHKGNIYKISAAGPIEQLFVDGKMMIEARWPNASFAQLLDRRVWAEAGEGSRYGKIVDPKLAETGIDWTGALATLNVAHQFFTWTRPVGGHAKGAGTLTYAKNLPVITSYADKTTQWEDDYYYLSGKIEALDAPTEWFHDASAGVLYLYADDGKSPAGRLVARKVRTYAFDVAGADYVELHGLRFMATTFRFVKCNHCLVDGCRLRFPSYGRQVPEMGDPRGQSAATTVQGDHNTVRNTSIAYAGGSGLRITGGGNLVENCIVHDTCWSGSLTYPAVDVKGETEGGPGCTVRRCTLYNSGNAILNYRRGAHVVEYNHAYNGGLLCKDVALVYTGQPSCAGSVVRYNWVHGCRTEGHVGRSGSGGLGIRGDDQTRRLTVHHNVVWDCGRDGIIVKGDHNRVYNNTVLDIGAPGGGGNYISLHTAPEPVKPWRDQFPLLKVQNAHSEILNNAALTITANAKGKPFPAGPNVGNNYQKGGLKLVDPAKNDFRPATGSPLIDAGRVIEGFTDGHAGTSPDIGAYEHGVKPWRAGADWTDAAVQER